MDVFKNGGLGYLAGFLIFSRHNCCCMYSSIISGNKKSSKPEPGPEPGPGPQLEWVAVGNDDLGGGTGYGNIMYSTDGKELDRNYYRR